MKAAILGCATALAVTATCIAAAQTAKPEDVIKFRKGLYTVVGWEIRPMAAMVKGETPFNKDLFARNATLIEHLAKVAPDAFVAGSDKGAETRARPEIWSDPDKFKIALTAFQTESAKMAEVARTATTVDQVRGQFGALGKTCAGCHDNFRTK